MRELSFYIIVVLSILISGAYKANAQNNKMLDANESEFISQIQWREFSIHEGIKIKTTHTNIFNSTQAIFLAEIDTSSLGLNFYVGLSDSLEPVSVQAKRENAILAINGSYFNIKEGYSQFFTKTNEIVKATTEEKEWGLRGGKSGLLSIDNNSMDISVWTKRKEKRNRENVEYALAAGPLIIDNNKALKLANIPFVTKRHPRSFAAFCNGNLLLGVVDGRDPDRAEGMNLYELYAFAKALGCSDFLNLDGGGSSTLFIGKGENKGVVNIPSDGNERPVSSIIYITSSNLTQQ